MQLGTARKPALSKSTEPQPSNFEGTLSHQVASPGPPLMTSIGLSRKESSTAFLSHGWTCQSPWARRSATRAWPRSSRSSAVSTASRTSPRVSKPSPSRSSKARSMVVSRLAISVFDIGNSAGKGLLRGMDLRSQVGDTATGAETKRSATWGQLQEAGETSRPGREEKDESHPQTKLVAAAPFQGGPGAGEERSGHAADQSAELPPRVERRRLHDAARPAGGEAPARAAEAGNDPGRTRHRIDRRAVRRRAHPRAGRCCLGGKERDPEEEPRGQCALLPGSARV